MSTCAFSVVMPVMEHFELMVVFEVERIMLGGHMIVYEPWSSSSAEDVEY